MPAWKKVVISGSDASLNTLTVSNGITGSLLGTAATSSYVNTLRQNVILSGSLTARETGFTLSGVFTGNTLGGIAMTTDSSAGYSFFTSGGTLQIYDNTNAATRFVLAANGGIACNSVTASLQGTSSHASTASFVDTLNQNLTLIGDQIITGSLTVTGTLIAPNPFLSAMAGM